MRVRRDPPVHDRPVEILEERVDVRGAIGLVVEEVRVLVDVERDERRRVPDGERVLRVAEVVEEAALVPVVRRPRPPTCGDRRRAQVLAPGLDRAEVPLDERAERPVRISALTAEVREVELVVLDPADREREVDLQRPNVRVHLVRLLEIDVAERAEDLVPLRDVPLIQAVVGLDGGARDAGELEQPRLERSGGDLLELRHGAPRVWRDETGGSISLRGNADPKERHGLLRARPRVSVRRARAAHRRAHDGDPPRQAPRRVRRQAQRRARGHRVDGSADRGRARESRCDPGRQARGRAQQRRRAREPHALLGDHGARWGRRAHGRPGGGDRRHLRLARRAQAAGQRRGREAVRLGLELARLGRRRARGHLDCRTRTRRSSRARRRSSASTSGSTPTT